MPAGLFGKLPAKRDFVAVNVSRGFLDVWESWMQTGMATARQTLGGEWSRAYNRAPIWRFWLGADFFGEAAIGAFMPSVDGVGRPFPLTIVAGENDGPLAPPEMDPNTAWCEAAETLLLSALEPGASLESLAAQAHALAPPTLAAPAPATSGLAEFPDGCVVARDPGGNLPQAFLAARRFGRRRAFAAQSFWWTVGGEGFPPTLLSQVGLPSSARFASLLTGGFEDPRQGGAREAE